MQLVYILLPILNDSKLLLHLIYSETLLPILELPLQVEWGLLLALILTRSANILPCSNRFTAQHRILRERIFPIQSQPFGQSARCSTFLEKKYGVKEFLMPLRTSSRTLIISHPIQTARQQPQK